MTSKIVVNNIEPDSGISSVTFTSNITGEDSTQNISGINSVTATSFHGSSVTATTFHGSGANLTGIDASSIKNGSDVKVQANASGAVVTGVLTTTAYRPGEIIETLTGMCDGRTLVGLSTSIVLSDITAYQSIISESYTDITGSTISYIPPIGTKTLIYRFTFHKATSGSGSGINPFGTDFIDSALNGLAITMQSPFLYDCVSKNRKYLKP